jgi:hypothetical protein
MLLSRLNGWPLDPEAERRVAAMVRYGISMTMPDRRMANFGDSSESDNRPVFAFLSRLTGVPMPWHGAAAGVNEIYANVPAVRPRHERQPLTRLYADTGYVCARGGWGERASAVVMHVTGFGGGHTHSDWLSFIYAFRGRTLITERGINTYDPGLENQRFREGRAHNVLQVGERDPIVHQLGMWDKYVNARARLLDFRSRRDGSAEWTGEIRYLDNTAWRRRAVFSAQSGRLVLEDSLRGPRADFTELRYHLKTTHARLVSAKECVTIDRGLPNIRIRVECPPGAKAELVPVGLSPSFWDRTEGRLLCFRCRPDLPATWRTVIEGV